jgi:hypothetical protein
MTSTSTQPAVDYNKKPVVDILAAILKGECSLEDLNDDTQSLIQKHANPFGEDISDRDGGLMVFQKVNTHEMLLKAFMTTSMVGYLFRRLSEYNRPENEPPYNLERADELRRDIASGKLVAPEWLKTQLTVKAFLDSCFDYNPDINVPAIYKEDAEKGQQYMSKDLKKRPMTLSQDQVLKFSDYAKLYLPPADFLHGFEDYINTNNDRLLEITKSIYPIPLDVIDCIRVLKTFSGKTSEDDAKKYVEMIKPKTSFDTHVARVGNWVISCARDSHNQSTLDVFTKDTEILKTMIDYHVANNQLARQMLQNRVAKKKTQNVAETGGDSGAVKNYMKERGVVSGTKTVLTSQAAAAQSAEVEKKVYDEKSDAKDIYNKTGFYLPTDATAQSAASSASSTTASVAATPAPSKRAVDFSDDGQSPPAGYTNGAVIKMSGGGTKLETSQFYMQTSTLLKQ